jgi:hypothetical protein
MTDGHILLKLFMGVAGKRPDNAKKFYHKKEFSSSRLDIFSF